MYCYLKYCENLPFELCPKKKPSIFSKGKSTTTLGSKSRSIIKENQFISSTAELKEFVNSETKFSSQSGALNSIEYVNKTILINPDCFIQILMDYIYEVMGIGKHCSLDLVDENGVILNVGTLKPYESATLLLQDQGTYIPVLYEKNPITDEYLKLEPLLYKSTKSDIDICTKIFDNLLSANKPVVTEAVPARKSIGSRSRKKRSISLSHTSLSQ